MSHDERVTHPDQHAAADTADPVGSTRLQPPSASREDQLGQAGREDDPDTVPSGESRRRRRLRRTVAAGSFILVVALIAAVFLVPVNAVIAVVLGIIGAIAYAMIASATWVRATIRSQDDAEAASSVHTVYPNPVACDAAQLNVAVDAPKETTVGAGMSIEATLTNEGGDACLLDIGGASLGAVINSGDQTVWTSTTCPAEPTERPLLVDVGESAHASLTWSGMSTAAGCSPSEPAPDPTPSPETSAAQDPSASPGASASPSPSPVNPNVAAAGTYRLHLQLDGTDITGEQVFLIQ